MQIDVFVAEANKTSLDDDGWLKKVTLREDVVRHRLEEDFTILKVIILTEMAVGQLLDACQTTNRDLSLILLYLFVYFTRRTLRTSATKVCLEEGERIWRVIWGGCKPGEDLEETVGGSDCSFEEGATEESAGGVITDLFLQFRQLHEVLLL